MGRCARGHRRGDPCGDGCLLDEIRRRGRSARKEDRIVPRPGTRLLRRAARGRRMLHGDLRRDERRTLLSTDRDGMHEGRRVLHLGLRRRDVRLPTHGRVLSARLIVEPTRHRVLRRDLRRRAEVRGLRARRRRVHGRASMLQQPMHRGELREVPRARRGVQRARGLLLRFGLVPRRQMLDVSHRR
jgi:hypothetical protein